MSDYYKIDTWRQVWDQKRLWIVMVVGWPFVTMAFGVAVEREWQLFAMGASGCAYGVILWRNAWRVRRNTDAQLRRMTEGVDCLPTSMAMAVEVAHEHALLAQRICAVGVVAFGVIATVGYAISGWL